MATMKRHFLLSYWPRYDYIYEYNYKATMERHLLSYLPRYDYNNMATMKRTFYYSTGQGMTIFIIIIICQPWKDTYYLTSQG